MKIKKLLALILTLCLLCGVLPFGAISANALTSGYYTYTVTDGKATITDVSTSISGNVTIPSTLGGYYVTSIGNYAFSFRTGLTSITIPDSVTSIGDDAFSYCTGLTSITIPDSVISIGERAFFSCSRLTSITIPDSVISIGDYAFYYCKKLTSITIGNSVTSIGDYAFSDCSGLTSITIPDSVTSIGGGAFSGCSGLTSITVDKRNLVYHSNGNCIIETNTKTLIAGCKNSVIPDDGSVTSIGNDAFYGCSGLTSITIPDSVTSIGNYAFCYCSGLTSITIGNSVTSIGDYAFYCCYDLTDIFYLGNKSDKEKITIGSNNATLTNAIWHYITGWVLDLEPTCEENGIEITSCTVCGKKMERYLNALGHSFGEWEVTKNPTCSEKGIETRKCTVCEEKEERGVNILPHNFNIIDFTPATCQSSGERVKICADCNHKETSVIAGGKHIYKNGKCVGCDITSEVVESKHNYDRNTNEVWTVTKKDADSLSVEFSSQTETESGYDFIYIYDKNDSLIGTYSGMELAGETITVTGDTVKIKLTSDNSSQKYGFYVTVTPVSSNIVIGDIDGNGELDADDILNIRFSILSGKSTPIYDINGDGVVNVKDLIKIKKLIAEAV